MGSKVRWLVTVTLLIATLGCGLRAGAADARLDKAYRFERDRWIYVHLQGSPADIGYQHGYLLAREIDGAIAAMKVRTLHDTHRDWNFYRETSQKVLWPHIEPEYRAELQGITDGAKAAGLNVDLWDIVTLNSSEEVPDYYVPWLDAKEKVAKAPSVHSPGNCSAFIATGSYTKDHKIVIAHNNWTGVYQGARWNIIFDIVPQKGYRFLMDGYPGIIASNDDFGVNAAGMVITETTISQFHGYDPNGVPEFVRARKAMQYATSIDQYVKIMVDHNNGGYANDWLIGDNKTGEIAQFELGLKHYKVWRTKDGYFAGSNWARDPLLLKDETTFDSNDKSTSANARRARWEQLIKPAKGQIDVAMAEKFLGDHFDTYENKEDANERTLCGHVEASPRGVPQWDWAPYYPGGAVQGKAMDSTMAKAMSFYARRGHPCGTDFLAEPFLKEHPEYDWQRAVLPDMQAGPWSLFRSGEAKP